MYIEVMCVLFYVVKDDFVFVGTKLREVFVVDV